MGQTCGSGPLPEDPPAPLQGPVWDLVLIGSSSSRATTTAPMATGKMTSLSERRRSTGGRS
jgi:hypothetical protein